MKDNAIEETEIEPLRQAKQQLERAGATLIGGVLNKLKKKGSGYYGKYGYGGYGYGYGYGYGDEE